jgi:hypothetical protein
MTKYKSDCDDKRDRKTLKYRHAKLENITTIRL